MRNNIFKKFELFLEATTASDDEYYEFVDKLYADSEEFKTLIRQGDQMAKQFANSDIITEKSDSGNLIIRYIVSENPKLLILIGIVSKEHKLVRGDVEDLKNWVLELSDYIKEGFKVMASTNKFSKPFVDKALKKLDKEGIEYSIERQPTPIEYKGVSWENIVIQKA